MNRRRTGTIARLIVIALVAATLTTLAPQAAAPVAADGNEAPTVPAFRSISAGGFHSCGILPSGALKCWGAGSTGQLGQGSSANLGDGPGEVAALPPVNLGPGRTAVAVSAGLQHTCAVLDDGSVKCWGRNEAGQLGQDSTTTLGDGPTEMAALPPVNLGPGRTAIAVSAANLHTCAVLDNGAVKCWGGGIDGTLGQDSTANLGDAPGEMAALGVVNLGAGRTATAVSTGTQHTCAVLDNGAVKCWGLVGSGKLGQGGSDTKLGDAPGEMAALAAVNLGSGRTARSVSAGGDHTCAVLDNNTVKCWGRGFEGQLGLDSQSSVGFLAGSVAAATPVNLGAGRTAISVSTGDSHSCAVLDNATVKCWGLGSSGQLGQDSAVNLGDSSGEMAALPAVNLGAGRTGTAVTAGRNHTCASLDNGAVKCWGAGANGALGQGSTDNLGDGAGEMAALSAIDLGVPIRVALTADQSRVDIGGVITYRLTIVNNTASTLTGVTVPNASALGCAEAKADLASGQSRTVDCEYTTSGADYPSRANAATVDTDQTALITSNQVTVAVNVPATVRSVTAGVSHTCALLEGGAVKCWGHGNEGRLGNGGFDDLGDAPGEMAALPSVNLGVGRTATAVSAGENHTCAVLDNGTVKCWGAGYVGQLGQDSTAVLGDEPGEMAALPAVNLGAGRTATAVSAGSGFTCALLDNATVKCWGTNNLGQLGQDSTAVLGDEPGEMAALPAVDLGAGRTATMVVAGGLHTCALLDDATVKCWGAGFGGQLGQDSTANLGDGPGEMAGLPSVDLGAGRTATAVAVGQYHSCAVLDNGAVKCWGFNPDGQLGQDSTVNLGDGAGEMAALPAVNLGAGRTATSVTAGASHTCAVLDDATVKCWGLGNDGQLGKDSTDALGNETGEMAALSVVNLGAGRAASAVSAGARTTCAVLDNGTVKCWGGGSFGALGQDSTQSLGNQVGEMAVLSPVYLGFGPGSASVGVALTAEETSVVVGDTIHYRLTVTNTGVPSLSGLTVSDPNAPDCVQAIADLAAGAHQTIDCEYTTTNADVGTYTNVATVDTAQTSPKASNTVNVTVTAPPTPALEVVKSADQTSVVVGEDVDLQVEVTNTGNVALTDVTIDDPNGPDCEADPFGLAVGEERTVDCTYVTTADDVGTYTNVASVTADEVTTPVESNEVEVDVEAAAPSLSIVKSAEEVSVSPGQAINYHLVVTNTGNVPLTAVDVADAAAPDCGDDATFSLAVGAFTTIDCTYTTTGNDVGTYANTASVTSTEVTTPVVSNQVDVTVTPAVEVVLSAEESSVVAGEVIRYELAVSNTSALSLSGLSVVDDAVADCESQVVPTLAPGADVTLDCGYVTLPADVGTFSNTATVDSSGIVAVTSNTVDTEVTVPPTSGLVSGTVTETGSGTPIVGAVAAMLSSADFSLAAVDITDAAGGFGVATDPGTYFVYVLDGSGGHAPGFHGAPSLVTVTAGSSATADTSLASTRGTVNGTVTADGGGPLEGVIAMTVDLSSGGPGPGALTGADGSYSIPGLRPGPRLVEFVDLSGEYRPEFFDDVPTPAGVQIVSVTGSSVSTADAGLAAQSPSTGGANLVGAVTATTGGPVEGVAVIAMRTSDFSLAAGDLTDSSGVYDIDVEPGTYRLAFYDPSGAHGFEWHDDQGPSGIADATVVTATVGAPLTTDATLTPTTGTLSGTVTGAAAAPLESIFVFAIDNSGAVVGVAPTDDSGAYRLEGLVPGGVRLRFVDPTGAHVTEYHADAPDYGAATVLTVTAGGATAGVDANLAVSG